MLIPVESPVSSCLGFFHVWKFLLCFAAKVIEIFFLRLFIRVLSGAHRGVLGSSSQQQLVSSGEQGEVGDTELQPLQQVSLSCVGGVEMLSAQGTIEIGDSKKCCTFKTITLLHNA